VEYIHRLCLGIIPLILIASCTTLGPPLEGPARDIHDAAKSNDLEKIKSLVQADTALLQAKDPGGNLPLHWAVYRGNVQVVRYLVVQGTNVNAINKEEFTPLHMAALSQSDNAEIAKFLLHHGAEIDGVARGSCPAGIVCARFLLSYKTPLDLAASNGNSAVAKILILEGADPNGGSKSWRPINYFSQYGLAEMVELVLEKGVSPNTPDINGNTPLHMAAKGMYISESERVMARLANPNREPSSTTKNMQDKGRINYSEIMELLIARGANLEAGNNSKRTPLHIAAEANNKAAADFLIAHGAKIDSRSSWGETPFFIAVDEGHLELAEMLLTNGADVNANKNGGWTPLLGAVRNQSLSMVKFLIANGANVNAVTDRQKTPLQYAKEDYRPNKPIIDLLIANGAK
jgi:ankyrin repeat protein